MNIRRISVLVLAGLACALALVFLVHGYWAFKIATVLILALAVRGLQLLIGASGQVSLGHGAFFAIGAYAAGVVVAQQWLSPYLAVPVAVVLCCVAGFLFGLPAVRLAGPYLALATFALALALPQLLKHPLLEPWTGGVSGLSLDPMNVPAVFAFLQVDQWILALTMGWTALIYLLLHRLMKGPAGLAWHMLRDHPTAATAVGVDVGRWKAAAFAVSSGVVGAAGALNTSLTSFVSPDSFPVFLSLSLLVGVAIASPRSKLGTFVAALFLSFVPDIAEKLSQELTGVLYGCVMLAAVFVPPLFGRWRNRAALARDRRAPAAGIDTIPPLSAPPGGRTLTQEN
ncbi:branched-chain amino acid ABC transporter permease [Variovorax paradoxus]|nr:branched-chain amino acid ABC transporter permease [Variovorax paradoxus]MBT2302482.1 branched-chain amino acid ABC transporter permease [Variovorax paradoxus]